MDEKTAKLAQQLKQDPALIKSLMGSRDGQALMQMLTRGDNGRELHKAVQSAAGGSPAEMMAMVQKLMHSSEGAALIQRINEAVQKQTF